MVTEAAVAIRGLFELEVVTVVDDVVIVVIYHR